MEGYLHRGALFEMAMSTCKHDVLAHDFESVSVALGTVRCAYMEHDCGRGATTSSRQQMSDSRTGAAQKEDS